MPADPYRPGPATAGLAVRSALLLAGQVVSTVIFAPLLILGMALPYRWRFALTTCWVHFNQWWLAFTCGLRHEVEGLENVPEQAGVVLCKHQSAWETITLHLYFAPQVWVVKRELLRLPFFGWGLAALRAIAIDRSAGKNAMVQIVEQGRARLEDGIWVVVFPEGTRVAPGRRRRYKLGGAVLAEQTGRPVVPVAHNSGDFWPRRSFIKRPGIIRLVIGAPIETAGRSAAEINRLAEHWIEETVARLRAPYAGGGEPLPGEGAGRGAESAPQ